MCPLGLFLFFSFGVWPVDKWHLLFSFLGAAMTRKECRPIFTSTVTVKVEERNFQLKKKVTALSLVQQNVTLPARHLILNTLHSSLSANKGIFNCFKRRQYEATLGDLGIHLIHNLFFFDVILFLRQRLHVKLKWEGFFDKLS